MDGLSKIDLKLDKPIVNNDVIHASPTTMKKKKNFKKFLKSRKMMVVLVILLLLVLFSVFGIYLPATKVYKLAKLTYTDAQAAGYAIKTQNVSLASDELVKVKADLTQTQKDLHAMAYLKFMPIASWY